MGDEADAHARRVVWLWGMGVMPAVGGVDHVHGSTAAHLCIIWQSQSTTQ